MIPNHALAKPFYPQMGCDSEKFSPLKQRYLVAWVSAETALLLLKLSAETALLRPFDSCSNPAPVKAFQRPREIATRS